MGRLNVTKMDYDENQIGGYSISEIRGYLETGERWKRDVLQFGDVIVGEIVLAMATVMSQIY